MKVVAYLIGFIVHWLSYRIVVALCGGGIEYLGIFLNSAFSSFLSAYIVGKILYRKEGTENNYIIPALFFFGLYNGFVGYVQVGKDAITSNALALAGIVTAFILYRIYLKRRECEKH